MPASAVIGNAASRTGWSPSVARAGSIARSSWPSSWRNISEPQMASRWRCAIWRWRSWANEGAPMKAMVLAAGLGTRLRPLTNDRPKSLVEIAGRTLLEITLARLRGFGIRQVIVNVHHFADMIVDYLKANNNFGMSLELSR